RLTVGTAPPPLLQEVLTYFVACQLPLLVRHPPDLGLLQELGVEPDQLLGEGGDGGEPSRPSDPGHAVPETRFQRGREPPLRAAAVGETAPPQEAPHTQCRLNPRSPMVQLRRPDHLPCLVLHQGEPCRPAARIQLEAEWLLCWLRDRPFQHN